MTQYLRYCPSLGRYIPSPRPFNLSHRYSLPTPQTFETLASDTTIQPGLQSPSSQFGPRQGIANAGSVKVTSPTESKLVQERTSKKRLIAGMVQLPIKPSPPEEGGEFFLSLSLSLLLLSPSQISLADFPLQLSIECCMSGCAHCVYDLYLEDVEHFHELVSESKSRILELLPTLPRAEQDQVERDWPVEVLGKFGEGEGESVKEKAERELKEARSALDPATR